MNKDAFQPHSLQNTQEKLFSYIREKIFFGVGLCFFFTGICYKKKKLYHIFSELLSVSLQTKYPKYFYFLHAL